MEDQHAASSETRISVNTSITRTGSVSGRLLGSRSLPQWLTSESAVPQDSALLPNLALQISPCLTDDLHQQAIDAVQSAVGPNADVRSVQCFKGTDRIGIWQRAYIPQIEPLRIIALENLDIIEPGETLGFFVNSSLIRSLATAAWANQVKDLDAHGSPSSDGPIHLTAFSWSPESPDRIVTEIKGYDERPWPDVAFTIKIDDTLSIQAGMVSVDSSEKTHADKSWLNALSVLSLLFFPPLAPIFIYESVKAGNAHAPKVGGVGATVAQLIPYEFMIPSGSKIVASYGRIDVSDGGVFAGGRWYLEKRAPKISIQGPSSIYVEEGTASAFNYFDVVAEDLRSPQFTWTADGSVVNQTGQGANIRFDLAGSRAGDRLQKHIAVHAIDEDDLTADADSVVSVIVLRNPDPWPGLGGGS